MGDLKGRRVVVTGGASGIGFGSAKMLAALGAEVCVVGRREGHLAEAVESLGSGAWFRACDVSSAEEVAGLAEAVEGRWGGLDGLVNNAGIAPMATLDDTSVELWDQVFAINVRGPYLGCRALGSLLKEGVSPAVVNVSSSLAVKAIPGMAAYNASKAALNQLTRSLALEWAPAIRVNAVMPGVVETPIHGSRGMDQTAVRQMARIHPLRRIGQPADVAELITYLLSDASSWMTGAVIPIDGGMTAT